MNTNIGIEENFLKEIAHEVSRILSDEFVLYVKTKNAHWNVEGVDFYNKHKFFEDQFEIIDDIIDDLAERIRTLGHYAPGTLKGFLQLTQLAEISRENNDSTGYIKELLTDHESIIIHLRKNINRFANDFQDAGTSDLITGIMEQHEKMVWVLRAHLK
jgi:starvation-inducible DNA-binding protein